MDKLKFINDEMTLIEVPYEFGQWSSEITYLYFVGEQTSPEEYTAEDGSEQSTILVTGFHRGKLIDLIKIKDKIKGHFSPVHGLRSKTDSGSIAVFFNGFFVVPTGDPELKKIQINLTVKEWKGVQ